MVFRINNVGATEKYFPVSQSFNSTPNRMALQNTYTSQSFTVVVNAGDIGRTAGARVNRIWYVKGSLDTGTVNMKLFFTERDPTGFLSTQDEVETGFNFTKIDIVQKDYTSNPNFINVSSGIDEKSFLYGTYANTEVYGQYTIGVSPNIIGSTNGITQFNRFSIVNPTNIILPVNVVNLRATQQQGKVKLDWTSLNELNVKNYNIERSGNALNFMQLGTVAALDNGQPRIDYTFTDVFPQKGDSYYRLKIQDKDGSVRYTNIVKININTVSSGFVVYPNPVTGQQFILQMNNLPSGKYNLQLFNTIGQQVMNKSFDYAGNSLTQTVRLSSAINSGAYIMMLSNGAAKFTQTIIVAQ